MWITLWKKSTFVNCLTNSVQSLCYQRDSIHSALEQKRKHHSILLQRIKQNRSLSSMQEQYIQQLLPSISPGRMNALKQQLQALKAQEAEFQENVDAAEVNLANHKHQHPLKKQKKECESLEKECEVIDESVLAERNSLKKLRVKCVLLAKEQEKLEKAIQQEKQRREERTRELQSIHEDAIEVPKGIESTTWEETAQILSQQQEKIQSASHLLKGLCSRQDHNVLQTLDTNETEQVEMENALKVITKDLVDCEV